MLNWSNNLCFKGPIWSFFSHPGFQLSDLPCKYLTNYISESPHIYKGRCLQSPERVDPWFSTQSGYFHLCFHNMQHYKSDSGGRSKGRIFVFSVKVTDRPETRKVEPFRFNKWFFSGRCRLSKWVIRVLAREKKWFRLVQAIIMWKWEEGWNCLPACCASLQRERERKLGVITVKLCYLVIFSSDTVVRKKEKKLELKMMLNTGFLPQTATEKICNTFSRNQRGWRVFRASARKCAMSTNGSNAVWTTSAVEIKVSKRYFSRMSLNSAAKAD